MVLASFKRDCGDNGAKGCHIPTAFSALPFGAGAQYCQKSFTRVVAELNSSCLPNYWRSRRWAPLPLNPLIFVFLIFLVLARKLWLSELYNVLFQSFSDPAGCSQMVPTPLLSVPL